MNRALIETAIENSKQTTIKLESILSAHDALSRAVPKPEFKKPNGRLTESGVRELRTMVDAGRTDGEIAKIIGITQPAAYNQRQNYLVEKLSPKRKR